MKTDFELIKKAIIRNEISTRVPLYEHYVDDPIIEEIMGYKFSYIDLSTVGGQVEVWRKRISFYEQMGYDYVPVELSPKFAKTKPLEADDTAVHTKGKREWADEHTGVIKSMDDVMDPDFWPNPDNALDYELFKRICGLLPDGMKIIGGAAGGPFEHACFLMGLERLCFAVYEDDELVEELFKKIGSILTGIASRLVKNDKLGAYRFGDDLGYKSATMLPPHLLRRYVFPWQKKVVDMAHKAGKPFVLHSCGQLEAVMDDLIDDVRIDAKHSFEDVIIPVTEAKKRWGHRVAILGGIDVDFLCRRSPKEIREHTKLVMELCSQGGGYAVGSGNSIANYIPVKNYLAMVEAAKEFNN